jgi:hypothetical protein
MGEREGDKGMKGAKEMKKKIILLPNLTHNAL